MPTINGKACVANGRNLVVQSDLKPGYLVRDDGSMTAWGNSNFNSENYIPTNGETVFTFSSPDYVFKGSLTNSLAMYDSDKKYLGWQTITSATQTLSKPNAAYIRFSINFVDEGGVDGNLSDWLAGHRYKLEKGSVATPLKPVPVDKVFSNGKQVYGRNLLAGVDSNIRQAPGWFQWIANVPTKFIKVGDPLCFSLFINNAPHAVELVKGSAYCDMQVKDVSGNIILEEKGNTINFDADGISQTSFVVPNAIDSILIFIQSINMSANTYYGYPKVEYGTTATPWSPAPEDVM